MIKSSGTRVEIWLNILGGPESSNLPSDKDDAHNSLSFPPSLLLSLLAPHHTNPQHSILKTILII